MVFQITHYALVSSYASFRLVDIPRIFSLIPLTVHELRLEVERSSEEACNILTSHWIEECAEVVREHKDSIEANVNQSSEVGGSLLAKTC